jgi:hypothetical protein
MERTRWLGLVAMMGMMGGSGCVVEVDCIDDDNDGVCWEDDCDDLDSSIGVCICNDADGDTVCDEDDFNNCVDDITLEYTCPVGCTSADNFCSDPWFINYCDDATSTWYNADCQEACTTDQATWSQACAAPALAGECSDGDGACLCWCEDSFDQCINDFTVQYTRAGTTYQIDCKEYCNGTCDVNAGACLCP